MNFKLSTWAKAFSLSGGALGAVATAGTFGVKWSPLLASVGGALVAVGAAMASQTSAGHPNGAL